VKTKRAVTIFTNDGNIKGFNHADILSALKPFYAPLTDEVVELNVDMVKPATRMGEMFTHRGTLDFDTSKITGNRLNWPAVLLYYAPEEMSAEHRRQIDKHIRETSLLLNNFVLLSGQLTSNFFALFIKDDGAEEQHVHMDVTGAGSYSEH